MKTCTKCGKEKDLSLFFKRARSKDGYQPTCKECSRAYHKEWSSKNAEHIALKWKEWVAQNPEKRKEASARYRKNNRAKVILATKKSMAKNPAKYLEIRKKWEQENVEKIQNKNYLRRARIVGAGVFEVSAKEIQKMRSKPCFYCGETSQHIDHVIPISRGGRHSIGNLVPACLSCNLSKSNKFLVEWKAS